MSSLSVLRDVALARSGEKGDMVYVAVVAYDPANFELIKSSVTAEVVATAYAGIVEGPVVRHELPKIASLNFELPGALDGGRTRNLAFDESGKTLASRLMSIPLDVEPVTTVGGRR